MKRVTAAIFAILFTLCILCGSAAAETGSASLPPEPLPPKNAAVNPYMATSEANIHNDCYNSDTTDAVLPLGICPEVNFATEKEGTNASPAIFFDQYDHAVSPLLGGIAIRDMDAQYTTTLGSYIPAKHDGGGYAIQVSYSFVDAENRLVCPTSNNHLVIFQTLDEAGNVLPVFEKRMDIDIKALAEKALGKTLTQNLLSAVLDYDGNLWFATGGFRIYPDRKQTGMLGYVSRAVIEDSLAGKTPDLENGVFFYEPEPGEAAENGIAAGKEGAVILTNLACYLFRANNGVEKVWRTAYESVGAKGSENGGGLAWGGGSSPTLTNDLVCFTDNRDPVNLLALDIKTGKAVATLPVLTDLPAGTLVSVENSIIVYDNGEGTTSAIICNWYGASNPGLADPDSDSSVQTFENIYNAKWIAQGNEYIMPGMERADIVKTADGYEAKSIWRRNDIQDTSMFKLSTATGYLYGYVQDMTTKMWQYIVLDFATGKTVLTVDVASKPGYNNMAIGMFCGSDGNSLYCPTGYLELLRLQDRFAYLPEMPYRKVDLDKTARHTVSADEFTKNGGTGTPATFLHTVTVDNVHPNTQLAIRVNGLNGPLTGYTLYGLDVAGNFTAVPAELWSFGGKATSAKPGDIVEILLTCKDGGDFDLAKDEKSVSVSLLLAGT